MEKVRFTSEKVAGFRCAPGKQQALHWDAKTPGLGLRVTASGAKSYIFETRLNGKTLRMTIGDIRTWTIGTAQIEATRLKSLTDQGVDPRRLLAAKETERAATEAAAAAAAIRDSVTLGEIWPKYIEDREPHWGVLHLRAHHKTMQAGGEKRKRSQKLTTAGPLALFASIRLVDITADRIEAWAKVEGKKRPASARLGIRMLNAFLTWCAAHATYSEIVSVNAAKSKKMRETLGKPAERDDVLEREQLPAWFEAVRQISNPVIRAYLQSLLLVGPRREEMAELRWADVDFRWNKIKLKDKIEDFRLVPLTPYVAHLLNHLPRRNEFVFSSPTAAAGYLAEPRHAHNEALQTAGLPHLTLHGLRRSFATLCEWIEVPTGISAQIQGHAPQGVREQKYIRRPLDLLRKWHVKIEAWILAEAGIEFVPATPGLKVVQK
jgi:integrase